MQKINHKTGSAIRRIVKPGGTYEKRLNAQQFIVKDVKLIHCLPACTYLLPHY